MATKESKKLLKTIRERFQLMLEADDNNRREAMDDFKFINEPGEQWEEIMKQERGNRPCYEFNKLRVTAKRIINDMRANTPSGKVRGVEGADKEIAEIYEGLIRNIWNNSDGDTVVDYASEYQVSAGLGSWRLTTDYLTNDAFDQDIKIEPISNPFCLYSDPSSKDMLKIDARDWILTEKISKSEYESKYPKAEIVDFDAHEFDDDEEWDIGDEVRIAEYWYKEPVTKELLLLQDGKVVDSESDEGQAIVTTQPDLIKKTRSVQTNKIMMCIASGESILEGPTEWAGSMFPFVQVYGEYMVIDGKFYWHGIGRFAKDAQRSYNVSRTAITETIAMAPQAKIWATTEQAKGNTDKWAQAHKENFPFILYNADPKAPGPPQRFGSADVPIALIQESQLASEEINMVTGIFAADVGAANQASSGRQEIARQQMGSVATFNYSDNRAKGIKRTWELLIDLIPKVYDTERELRILGSDGAEDYKKVNSFVLGPEGQPIKINDLSFGRYDATITIGPSFSTRRQEAAEIYQQLMQGNPEVFGVAGDLIFKSMDLPYSEDIAERLQTMLPPQIQQMINNEQQLPPEVMAMMEQAKQAMAMVEQQAQVVQQEAQKTDMAKSEVEKLIAELETKKAQFDAHVAKQLSQVEMKNAKVTLKGIENEREKFINQDQNAIEGVRQMANEQVAQTMAQAVSNIQEMAAAFNEYAASAVKEIREEKNTERKPIRVDAVRKNGKLSAVPIYDDVGKRSSEEMEVPDSETLQ